MPVLPADRIVVVRAPAAATPRRPVHDPRSVYVERFWVGTLGPSATLLLRYITTELEASPAGFVLHYDEVARQLGVRGTGRNSPFYKALQRLCFFGLAELLPATSSPTERLAVVTSVPTLGHALVARLPETLQQRHAFFLKQQTDLQSA